MDGFRGFPPEALAFFAGLEADNSKAYWQMNKPTWDERVEAPMEEFLALLTPRFGPFRRFRPYRDVRFSKDKSPYKTQIGAVAERAGAAGRYVHLDAAGLLAVAGAYALARDQVERFRAAVADDRTGAELALIAATVEASGAALRPGLEPPLKRIPRGYPADHPRAGWLRWKGLAAVREFGDPPWLGTPEAVERVAAFWRAAAPLDAWLDAHVGPSQEPPHERGRRGR